MAGSICPSYKSISLYDLRNISFNKVKALISWLQEKIADLILDEIIY